MITQALHRNSNGTEACMETNRFNCHPNNLDLTKQELSVFATGSKQLKVEQFRYGIAATLRAIKFAKYEEEEA